MNRSDDERPRELADGFDPSAYPALEGFFLAYFHEDFELVYGTPEATMDAFLADGGAEDYVLLARDWEALRRWVEHLDEEHRLDVLGRLGGAWQPACWRDVETVFGRLLHALEEPDVE